MSGYSVNQVALTDYATDAVSTEGSMSVLNFLGDAFRKARDRAIDDLLAEGYGEAAETCMGVLSEKIDDLTSQLKDGLSEKDQFLLSSLCEIRAEAEAALRRRARDLGIA